MNFLVVSGW